jgi:cytochrome bd ubiquinol oxidase subunit II
MGNLWFCLVAVMLTVYVILDGFDIGVGIVHIVVARTDQERRLVLRSIGPVWDGNEVWLVAAGGTLYFAFPALYASSFSGFYLPLMMVLWFLILRGISIEFRSHVEGLVWPAFWDAVFVLASISLAIFYGAALGNVIRGVPLDEHGLFFEALWTNFRPGPNPGILDWFTILVGVTSLAALTLHGACWLAFRTEGDIRARARKIGGLVWWLVAGATVLVTIASFRLQPHLWPGLSSHIWNFVFPFIAVAGLVGVKWFSAIGDDRRTFLSSCAYLLGMLTSVAASLYPYVLPASTRAEYGLTVANTQAAAHGLLIGLAWWTIGMALATGYSVFVYRHFAGKVKLPEKGEGY